MRKYIRVHIYLGTPHSLPSAEVVFSLMLCHPALGAALRVRGHVVYLDPEVVVEASLNALWVPIVILGDGIEVEEQAMEKLTLGEETAWEHLKDRG